MFGFYLCVVEKLFNLGIIFWKVNIVFENGFKRKMFQVYYVNIILMLFLEKVWKIFINYLY